MELPELCEARHISKQCLQLEDSFLENPLSPDLSQALLLAALYICTVKLFYSFSLSLDQKTKQWRLKVFILRVSYIVIPDGS